MTARIGLRVVVLVGLAAAVGCVTKTYQNAIEVKGGATVEERVRWAESYVTQARLDRLKVQLKERLPSITDQQLSMMGLRWNQTTFQSFTGQGSTTTVTISVGIQYDNSFDPAPIIAAASAILEPEINGAFALPASKVAP
jgi:hypothetical protein